MGAQCRKKWLINFFSQTFYKINKLIPESGQKNTTVFLSPPMSYEFCENVSPLAKKFGENVPENFGPKASNNVIYNKIARRFTQVQGIMF